MINNKINFVDIGSAGGLEWPWSKLPKNLLNLYLCDPREEDDSKNNIIRNILWSENTKKEFNYFNQEETSSLFKPNIDYLKNFPNVERFNLNKTENFETKTIDHYVKNKIINDIDFIKIDAQGAELNILEGGENFLKKNLVGLQVEVEFNEIYKDQPLFYKLDSYIRKNLDLQLWDLQPHYWTYKNNLKQPNTKGQLVYADALYFKPLNSLENMSKNLPTDKFTNKIFSLIYTSIMYGYYDYAQFILNNNISNSSLNTDQINFLNKYLIKSSKCIKPFKKGNYYLNNILELITNVFKYQQNGWSSGGSSLGTRKFWLFRK
tara:strand:+ start:44 stop:1003 length:960 start_codon:yes stop_codon:yes gene_type:complete